MENSQSKKRNPWAWVPTLYYAEGIPYIIVMTVSVIMYKRLGISNSDIALYTSWLYLPWVIKPLWSPIIEIFRTKRFWIVSMQLLIGAGLAGVALTIPVPDFFQYTLAFFWLLAFSSATHDMAADGFYMLGLSKHDQAFFVGVRSTFYRGAMITGQGLLIILAGFIESSTGLPPVEIDVTADNNMVTTVVEHPDSMTITGKNGELVILTAPGELKVNTTNITKQKADSLMAFVKEHNISNGFYQADEVKAAAVNSDGPSWWGKNVAIPLEGVISDLFAPEKPARAVDNFRGNMAYTAFYLSAEPATDEPVVLNLSMDSGDKDIKLIEGTRFEFTKENWNKPALALFQLDKKLKGHAATVFIGHSGNIPLAWIVTFTILAVMFILFFVYHRFMLPNTPNDAPAKKGASEGVFSEFIKTFVLFFKKKNIGIAIAFLLVYRLGESQLVKLANPFLLDSRELGGLGLTTDEVGLIYGTVGVLALTFGGILGGVVAAKKGLKYWLWWMVLAMNLPNAVYVYLSFMQPDSFFVTMSAVAVEQFGYGFGFTAYMLFMIYISEGEYKTAHFSITTGFMALGMMIPGMISGWLQEIVGYERFFIWVLIATIPAFVITKFINVDPEFGKKSASEEAESTS